MKAGWEVKRIGEVCTLSTGGTPKRSEPAYFKDGRIKWLVSGDINRGQITDCEGRITELGLDNSNARYLPVNSIMIALNGQGKTRGTVAMLRTEATCNQSLVSIMPNDPSNLLSEYVFANLYGRYEEIRKMTGDTGNDRRGLNMPLIRGIEIPIAPLDEQKRIVAILDAAFDGLARARANVEANLQNARELYDSSLDTIFGSSGPDWRKLAISDLCVIGDGNHSSKYPKKSEMVTNGVPFIRSSNIQNGKIDVTEMLYISEEKHSELKKGHLKSDDILFTNRGEIGKVAIVTDSLDGANLNSQVAWLRCFEQVLPRFLFFFLQSGRMKQHYLNTQSGSALQQFTIKMLKSVSVNLPDTRTQTIAVERMEKILEATRQMEDVYSEKLADLDELRQSLLQKAFAGELT